MPEEAMAIPVWRRWEKLRNLTAFWFLGLTNNFAYVVMLSAAHDILKEEEGGYINNGTANGTTVAPVTATPAGNVTSTPDPSVEYLTCNAISTGVILLADILPTLVIKMTAPFYIQRMSYRFKVSLVIMFAMASFLIVAFAHEVWLSIIGVVCASCSGGLGEITFLSMTAFYDQKVVATWSSGTGAAGVAGALGYAGLTAVMSPRNTVLSLVVIPVIMAISYFLVLTKPEVTQTVISVEETDSNSDTTMLLKEEEVKPKRKVLTAKDKLRLLPPLMKYMIPLTTVYFAEYFINQGLHELLYFNNTDFLNKAGQYRWYQVSYQIGVFISRSTVTCCPIPTRWLWVLPLLQVGNMALLIAQVFYRFIPFFEILIAIIVYEGLLGGSAYVNTFYKIREEVAPEVREYSLGVATVGDTVGIALAGVAAIPSHNHICTLRIRM
ncbi:battenin-like [Littorina saxatilis]|uniref:Battenin n=1 Tax=Littorina saxatilis TaxID=31220 RepID=A0AAN9BCC8_9CAEN